MKTFKYILKDGKRKMRIFPIQRERAKEENTLLPKLIDIFSLNKETASLVVYQRNFLFWKKIHTYYMM